MLALEGSFHDGGFRSQRVAHLCLLDDVVVHEQVIQHIHAQQFGWMGVEVKLTENRLNINHFAGARLEQVDHLLGQLCLVQAASALFVFAL